MLGLFMLEQVDYWTARIKAVRSLRGKFGNYSLKLEARDLGVPSNKETAILDICVTDYNDNPPIFISPQHNTTIRVSEVKIYFNHFTHNSIFSFRLFSNY